MPIDEARAVALRLGNAPTLPTPPRTIDAQVLFGRRPAAVLK
jgi:hypothetical protein